MKEIAKELDDTKTINFYRIGGDHDKLLASRERVMDLSSKYYEIIALSQYKDQISPSIGDVHALRA